MNSGMDTSGMDKKGDQQADPADIFTEMLRIQGEAARQIMQTFAPGAADHLPDSSAIDEMGAAMMQMQENFLQWHLPAEKRPAPMLADPKSWLAAMQKYTASMPMLDLQKQQKLWSDGMQLWQHAMAQYAEKGEAELPRKDSRFADPAWREQPVFMLIHQTYLLLAERISEAVDTAEGLDEKERRDLRFATKSVLDAMSPANFPMMNPVVLERTIETRGENLHKGMHRLSSDLERGQLTHTDSSQFVLGENVAATPGKVIYETDLFQIIQYAPATRTVMETPLLIFPPWINRFYILDLNYKKSFVRWAVEQGITVLMVSWRSADEQLGDLEPDAYVAAQMEAIDVVRERLKVPSVHAVGYCVGGTTLAMTLAVLARNGQAEKVKSATFLTAQVDFEHAGDLATFVDDPKMELVRQASKGGYLDGRYMAATFNLLRGSDLIWNYVVNHYLLGEDYPAFDLLYWNSDVTNLPARWHKAYLQNCYRDNKLVQPDALEACGTRIDLRLIETPAYVQAGREDHIAPPKSVIRILDHFNGPTRFILAGSGHIAGVVNPPDANKYQYWVGPENPDGVEAFVDNAKEHKGSWWPDWLEWMRSHGDEDVKATGVRKPGSKASPAIEDAPGRYVKMR